MAPIDFNPSRRREAGRPSRQRPPAGIPPRRHRPGYLHLRRHCPLPPLQRQALYDHRDHLLAELAELDDDAVALAHRRRHLVDELRAARDELWRRDAHVHARRPPVHGQPPLPPVVDDPILLWGRPLRSTLLALLGQLGPTELPDLHRELHLRGYDLATDHPVKALSDALAYEVEQGRAIRVRRGCYALRPGIRAPRLDPCVRHDPLMGEADEQQERPVDDTPVHTDELPQLPVRDRTIPASAWAEAPPAIRTLGADIGHDLVAYKREINGWLLWRAGPASRGDARYGAVRRNDPTGTIFTFRLFPDGTGDGTGPDGRHHHRFRAWKESLRDHP